MAVRGPRPRAGILDAAPFADRAEELLEGLVRGSVIADTSGLLAFFNARQPAHQAVRAAVDELDQPLVVSPFIVAELDYLVGTRLGVEAELSVLEELAGGAYHLPAFGVTDIDAASDVIRSCADQQIGIADASIVVLAARLRTRTILTLDRRHFELLRPLDGARFTLIP